MTKTSLQREVDSKSLPMASSSTDSDRGSGIDLPRRTLRHRLIAKMSGKRPRSASSSEPSPKPVHPSSSSSNRVAKMVVNRLLRIGLLLKGRTGSGSHPSTHQSGDGQASVTDVEDGTEGEVPDGQASVTGVEDGTEGEVPAKPTCAGDYLPDAKDEAAPSAAPALANDYMCTVLCDLLFSIPMPRSVERNLKVGTALEQCYDSYEDKEGFSDLDIRGLCADEAKELLIRCLCDWPLPPWRLNVIVGCKVHGVGEGKLKKAVIDLLKHDKTIKWRKKFAGSVICIKLGGKRYPYLSELDKSVRLSILPSDDNDDDYDDGFDDEYDDDYIPLSLDCASDKGSSIVAPSTTVPCKVMNREVDALQALIDEYEKRPLCTVACDLLFDLRRPHDQHCDEEVSKRVLAGFDRCCESDSEKCIEDTNKVDLRGLYVEDAIKKLIKHLHRCSHLTPLGYLHVTVGCKRHGVGEGKLKQAIIAVLNSDKTIEFDKDDRDYIISIKLDDEKDYSSLIEVSHDRFLSHSDHGFSNSPCSGSDKLVKDDAEKGLFPVKDFVVGHCSSKNKVEETTDFEWTIACDLLFGPSRPLNQCPREEVSEMVLAGCYQKCDGGATSFKISRRVNLLGRSIDELAMILAFNLDIWSNPPAPGWDFIIGCNLHGFGEGKLRQVIVDLLNRAKMDWVDGYIGSGIFINFGCRKDDSSTGKKLTDHIHFVTEVEVLKGMEGRSTYKQHSAIVVGDES